MSYTDADTNLGNEILKTQSSASTRQKIMKKKKYTSPVGDSPELSSKVWHTEFDSYFELSSTSFAKHYGTKVLTDCKCFCG